MQAHIRRLKAEPSEHSVIVITFIEISRHLKITDCFGGARSRSPYSNSNFTQSRLYPFWTLVYVFVNTRRSDEI